MKTTDKNTTILHYIPEEYNPETGKWEVLGSWKKERAYTSKGAAMKMLKVGMWFKPTPKRRMRIDHFTVTSVEYEYLTEDKTILQG